MTIAFALLAVWLGGLLLGYQWGRDRERKRIVGWITGLAAMRTQAEQDPPKPTATVPAPEFWWMDDNGTRIRHEPRQ